MTWRTPHLGPHAGRLCRVLDDGTLEPCAEVDSARQPPPVALPEVVTTSSSHSIEAGEIPGYDTRGSIAQLARTLASNGFSDPWGRAHQAARDWDRGIRDGTITRAT